MKYQTYPAYKDSGVEWLGDVPEHWTVAELKRFSSVKGGYAFNSDSFVEDGEPVIRISDIKQDGSVSLENCKCVSAEIAKKYGEFSVSFGELVMAMTGATIGKAGWFKEEKPALVNQRVGVFKSNQNYLNYRFFWYVLSSHGYQEHIQITAFGGAQPNISDTGMVGYKTTIPIIEEQQKIAQFLDHETAKIDTLIEKQQRLIELLKEKRQAVISHAVTKGLNPNAPMKDSGVEWLGEVPEHWRVCAIKHQLFSLDFKRIPLSAEERGSRSGEYRYYGASGVIDYIDDYIFDESTILVGEDGANLVNRSTPLAFSAHGKYWVNNHAHILKSNDGLADYWAETIEHIDINPIVSGSAQPKLTAENLNNLKIAFPPSVEERIAINNFILDIKSKFDLLMNKAKEQIELLQERRTALISAAVTGKIDVRNWSEK